MVSTSWAFAWSFSLRYWSWLVEHRLRNRWIICRKAYSSRKKWGKQLDSYHSCSYQISKASDFCSLYSHVKTDQLHKIFKLCGSPSDDYWTKLKLQLSTPLRPIYPYGSHIAETFKQFPASVISLLETLLSIDPDFRGTAASALKSKVSLDFTYSSDKNVVLVTSTDYTLHCETVLQNWAIGLWSILSTKIPFK